MTTAKGDDITLRKMKSSDLLETFCVKYYNFRIRLACAEDTPYHSVEEARKYIKEEYEIKTSSLRQEVDRRFPVKS